jgi:hypothetical protein
VAAHAPDVAPFDPRWLAALTPDQQDALRFVPHPSVTVLSPRYPADAIADAVLSGDAAAMASVDPTSGPVVVVTHRGPEGVASERATPDQADFLRGLFGGETLGSLLARNVADAAALLGRQFALGRVAGVAR